MKRALPYLASLLTAGCALPPMVSQNPPSAASVRTSGADVTAGPVDDRKATASGVQSTILAGQPQVAPLRSVTPPSEGGPVSLDFRGVDVQAVARAVLGDLLQVPYTLAPDVHATVTLQTRRRVPRSQVVPALEASLRQAGLALVSRPGGAFAILPIEQARSVAAVAGPSSIGFGTEVVRLSFVNAAELQRLIDPVLPGVVTAIDPVTNSLTISGTQGQRASAHDLVSQFDVDWLRGTSFGLYVPHQTDSRLIVPELNKVLNAEGSPTHNMVRLIAMENLNGILAVSTQPQYLEDVRRWVEILDREGEGSARSLFVYKVQNGRASDLARVLASAFGQGGAVTKSSQPGFQDSQRPPGTIGVLPSDGQGSTSSGFGGASQAPGQSTPSGYGPSSGGAFAGQAGGPNAHDASQGPAQTGTSIDVRADDFKARITSDEINNAIVVYATPHDYAIVENALRKLDVPPNQVMIQAAIAEITLTDTLRFGVQGLYSNAGTSVGLTESATSALPIQTFPGFSALYSARTVSAALNALEGLTKVKVVSAPKLMVLNNQTASIEVGDQVPILTGTATSTLTSGAPVVNSVDYRDTGIILKVTPRVNSSGVVLLDLAQEVSAVVSASTSSEIDSPTISTRRIATSVAVQNGEVIALGGLISDNRTDTTTGLPGLSRIPILGPLLFGNINNNDVRTELVVLLQPTVVRNVDDGRAVTEELRQKLRGLRGILPSQGMP